MTDDTLSRIERLSYDRTVLLNEIRRLMRSYVNMLENGRDRIISLGGTCDPVDVMEAGDPFLLAAKAAIAKVEAAA